MAINKTKLSTRQKKEAHQHKGLKIELKKIYKGVKKLLDKNSKEYKEIVEKNKEAWKRLANL